MKKVMFLLFLLAVACGSAFSSPLLLGVKAGLDLSNFSGTDASTLAKNDSKDSLATLKSKAGFAGGVFFGINVGGTWAIQPEVLYVMKGTKISAAHVTGNINLNYFEIPVLLKLNLLPTKSAISPYVFAGPSLSFNAASNVSGLDGTPSIKDGVRNADFGLVVGAGLDIQKFSLDVRYDLGLQNPMKAEPGGFTPSIHNGTIYILAGFRFI
jgi:hypothetical protein